MRLVLNNEFSTKYQIKMAKGWHPPHSQELK